MENRTSTAQADAFARANAGAP